MKKLFLSLVLTFVSVNAFAWTLTPRDSWETIFASREYSANPTFPVFGPKGIFNSCATDTDIVAVQAVKVCVEQVYHAPTNERDNGGMVCVRTEYRNTSMPRRGLSKVCVKYGHETESHDAECLKWENRAYEVSLTQSVEVLVDRGGERGAEHAFVKNYTIPACSQ